MFLICAFCVLFVQITTGHVFSYAPQNMQPLQGQEFQNSFTPPVNNRAASRPFPYTSYNANNMINANAEFENARIANTQANVANAKFANAQRTNAELAQFSNGFANAELANSNTAKAELNRFQPSWARNMGNAVNANVEAVNTGIENAGLWAKNHLVNLNGNMATFNVGDGTRTFTITSGSPNSPAFGLQLMADALEVGGTVSVNGQYPIFGTVAVNGNLPTDGSASVNYNSGRPVTA